MYIYLENNYFIPLNEIIAAVSYNKFTESEYSKDFLNRNKNNIINLSDGKRGSIIITDNYFYITSLTGRAIYNRGNEFKNIKRNKRNT